MSETVNVELEIDNELMKWFEQYCEDGLLDLDEEIQAVLGQYMQEQIEDAGDVAEPLTFEEDDEEDADELLAFDEEKDE